MNSGDIVYFDRPTGVVEARILVFHSDDLVTIQARYDLDSTGRARGGFLGDVKRMDVRDLRPKFVRAG